MASDDQATSPLSPSLRYYFSNAYMRDSILEIEAWKVLFAPGASEYLEGMWQRCLAAYPECEPLPSDGLELQPAQRWEDWHILPIAFPPPSVLGETYFGAIAVRPGRRVGWFKKHPLLVRYFLLEFGLTGPQLTEKRTVLGEWVRTGHLNYGDGPSPAMPAFLARVTDILRENPVPSAGFIRPADGWPDPNALEEEK